MECLVHEHEQPRADLTSVLAVHKASDEVTIIQFFLLHYLLCFLCVGFILMAIPHGLQVASTDAELT